MNFAWFVARRYFVSKKNTNAIQIISNISMLGVFVGTTALVIILSVFNGFEELVLSLYNTFTPEIKITAASGKLLDPSFTDYNSLKKNPSVIYYVEVLEEKALLKYNDKQFIGVVKGVSSEFAEAGFLDSMMIQGKMNLGNKNRPFAIIGAGVAYNLGLQVDQTFETLSIFSPKKEISNSLVPGDDFNRMEIYPAGIFSVQQEFDDKLVIVPLTFARELLNESKKISSIELTTKKGTNVDELIKEIKSSLGKEFKIQNRYQQNQLLYKILNSEKWAVYLILTFILMIAICNIVGSLTMLVIDKKKDISIMMSMGASRGLIRRIFLLEGVLIAFVGAMAGLIVATLFCVAQQKFGLIQMGSGEIFETRAYPIVLKISDYFLVSATVMGIALLASLITSGLSVKGSGLIREE